MVSYDLTWDLWPNYQDFLVTWSQGAGIWFLLSNSAQCACALHTKPRLWALSATEHIPPDVPNSSQTHTWPNPFPRDDMRTHLF